MVIERVGRLLEQAASVLLVAHREPDGDALGATLGLMHLLEARGKRCFAHSAGPLPEEYAFLPGVERLGADLPAQVDVAVLLDCHEPDRAGPLAGAFLPGLAQAVVIDHHQGAADFGVAAWVDASYAATCEMLAVLAARQGWALTPPAATCLFVGLQTDTGSFRYGNTTPRALRVAADLVEAGAEPWVISQEVYATRPVRLRILGQVMDRLELLAGGRLAVAKVSLADLARLGARSQDLEQAVEAMRGVPGVEVAALLKEVAADEVKLSMRARGRVNVAEVAMALGGGGHRNAAGARLQLGLEQARTRMIDILTPLAEGL